MKLLSHRYVKALNNKLLLLIAATALHAAEKPNIILIFADDLGETNNLAAAMPEKVAEMKALLDKPITDGSSTPGAPQKNDVEVTRHPIRKPHPAK